MLPLLSAHALSARACHASAPGLLRGCAWASGLQVRPQGAPFQPPTKVSTALDDRRFTQLGRHGRFFSSALLFKGSNLGRIFRSLNRGADNSPPSFRATREISLRPFNHPLRGRTRGRIFKRLNLGGQTLRGCTWGSVKRLKLGVGPLGPT